MESLPPPRLIRSRQRADRPPVQASRSTSAPSGWNRHLKKKRPGVFSEHVRGEATADVDGSTERRDAPARPEDRIRSIYSQFAGGTYNR